MNRNDPSTAVFCSTLAVSSLAGTVRTVAPPTGKPCSSTTTPSIVQTSAVGMGPEPIFA